MTREQISPAAVERRCPNCGTRVARDAGSCFMCGHNLRIQPRRAQRVALVDILLVLAVVAVLVIWWRLGSQPQVEAPSQAQAGIFPSSVPLMTPTSTAGPTPTATVTPTPTLPPQNYVTHEVQAGETLGEIADSYNVSVQEIQDANNLNDVLIHVGDQLIIPVPGTPAAAGAAPTATVITAQTQYVVRTGDTIISIALTFGSSVDDILRANNLGPNDLIRPGDVLNVPIRQLPPEVPKSAKPTTTSSNTQADAGLQARTETIYIEPRLIGPPDQTTVPRDQAVLLRWISVDVLAPNEWYVLLITPAADNAKSLPSIWTKATSYRLDATMAPEVGQSATYAWQVSVVRVKSGNNGQMVLEAASPASSLRQFIWK